MTMGQLKLEYQIKYFLLFLLFSNLWVKLSAQEYCTFNIGEIINLKSTANFRQLPNTKSEIIYTFSADSKINFVVVDNIYNNGYLKVRLKVRETERDTSIIRLNDTVGWISFNLVKSRITIYRSGDVPVEDYDASIQEILEYKFQNLCKYSEYSLAFCYQQRGIVKYENRDFFGAVQDLTSSIQLNTEVCFSYSYFYRAKAKQDLEDFSGAVSDYNLALKQCTLSIADDLCRCLQCSHEDFYYVPHAFCTEDIYIQRSYCKSMLNNNNGALIDLNTVIAMSPEYGYAYYIRGQIKCNMNNMIGGCADLSKAGELGIKEAYDEIHMRCNK